MITVKQCEGHIYGVTPSEIYGKSTDVKPMDANNASVFYEMDTGKMFMFDEDSCEWLEQKFA